MNNNISFKSHIRPVSIKEFTEASEDIYKKATVEYPWLSSATIKAPKAYTMDIFDCSAGGIVDEEKGEVVLFHICPSTPENKDFNKVEKDIMNLVDTKQRKLRSFLLGSQSMFKDSTRLFNNIENMLKEKNIKTSIFKVAKDDQTHILYNGQNNEWMISNHKINHWLKDGRKNKNEILKDNFYTVELAEGDCID